MLTNATDSMPALSVPLDQLSSSILDLEVLVRRSLSDQTILYTCTHAGCHGNLSLLCPDVLLMHILQRTTASRKVMTRIRLPPRLWFANGMEYQLRAAVVHEGQSTSSDHFYRLVWSDDDRCIRCDDQRITELRAEEAAQSSAAALTLAEMTGNV